MEIKEYVIPEYLCAVKCQNPGKRGHNSMFFHYTHNCSYISIACQNTIIFLNLKTKQYKLSSEVIRPEGNIARKLKYIFLNISWQKWNVIHDHSVAVFCIKLLQ